MAKHYTYRMDHDYGYAPNPSGGVCTLCGCKKSTIERWAKRGSWIIGIGGNNTGLPDKLIYAMQVEESLSYSDFQLRYPSRSRYLVGNGILSSDSVLISHNFYYLGNKAIDVPEYLQDIIHRRWGCKCITDVQVDRICNLIKGDFKRVGKHGDPANIISNSC